MKIELKNKRNQNNKFHKFKGGNTMPTKDTLIYIGMEDDGTKVYWSPYYCMTEYHKPDGKVIRIAIKS